TGDDPSVLVRMKEEYDGAEPSASAVGAMNLLVLGRLTGEAHYEQRAREVFAAFGSRLTAMGRALPFMAAALATAHAEPEQLAVVGAPDDAHTQALWHAANERFRPFATFVPIAPGERQQALGALMPWTAAMTLRDGQPAAYVCRSF